MTFESQDVIGSAPEGEQREAALTAIQGELGDLMSDVDQKDNHQDFLSQRNYFGLPCETRAQKELLKSALSQLVLDTETSAQDLPVELIKSKLLEAQDKETSTVARASFTELFNQLKTKQVSNKSYINHVLALAEKDATAVPEEFVFQYQQFQKLLSPTLISNSQDRSTIEDSLSSLDLATNPDPIAFIQSEILNNALVSDETKKKIVEAFDLLPFEAGSGTEIAKGLTEKIVNPETGEMEYRFNETRKLEYRAGLKAFNESATGNKIITAELADGRARDFDVTGWPASTLTEFSDYLMLWRVTEQAGISNFMEDVFYVDMALIDDFDPAKARQSRQTIDALLGSHKGYDGRIMSESDGEFLVWMLQAFSPKGDAAQGDYDIHSSNQWLVELGIKDESGQINFEVLKSAGSYLRGIYLSGEPSFDGLQKHLKSVEIT